MNYDQLFMHVHLAIGPKVYPPGLIAERIETTWIRLLRQKLPCLYQHGSITGYRIEIYHGNQTELSGTLTGADSTMFTAECFQPLTHYQFRVEAINDAGIE